MTCDSTVVPNVGGAETRVDFLIDTVFIAVYAPPSPLRSLTVVSLVSAVAMGASVWFVMRRLVLTSWPQKTWRSARPELVPVPKGLLFLGFTRTPVALLVLCVVTSGLSYPTDAVESWSTNLRHVVRMASTVMALDPAST